MVFEIYYDLQFFIKFIREKKTYLKLFSGHQRKLNLESRTEKRLKILYKIEIMIQKHTNKTPIQQQKPLGMWKNKCLCSSSVMHKGDTTEQMETHGPYSVQTMQKIW